MTAPWILVPDSIRLAGVEFWGVLEADPGLAGALLRRLGRRMREILQPLAD